MRKNRKHYLKTRDFPRLACGKQITPETDFTQLTQGVRCPECREKRQFPHCSQCDRYGHLDTQCDMIGWARDARRYQRKLIEKRSKKRKQENATKAWCVYSAQDRKWHATSGNHSPHFLCHLVCSSRNAFFLRSMLYDFRAPTCPGCKHLLRLEKLLGAPGPVRTVKMHRTRPARVQDDPDSGDNNDGGNS